MTKVKGSLFAVLVASCGPTKSATPASEPCSPSPEGGSALDATAAPDSSDVAGCSVPGALVSYLHTTTSDISDTRCGPPSNGMCTIDLEGFLYIPQGAPGPLPAIVYSHGSEQLPGPKCSIADYFVPLGYVVFVPHRRGQGRSTGQYIGTYTAGSQISYLQDQVADLTDAWSYLRALSTASDTAVVDPKRMALMGHSYGGIMTLLTNATALGQVAAVDLCGDSESWGAADIESTLLAAVDGAQAPIFFAQPQNDVHTEPTVVYSGRAGTDGHLYQATIYPPVPNASSPEDAHSRFVADAPEVAQWASGALDFLRLYGM
jgi:pimeloyl-ACP methyl ester carboxylesterase